MSEIVDLPISVPVDLIAAFCCKWEIIELALFGSALRDDFGPGSDIDLLVEFAPAARPSLVDLDEMELELKQLFGRDVDLVMKTAVEESENYIRRKEILRSANVIYKSRSGIPAGHAHRIPPGADVRTGA